MRVWFSKGEQRKFFDEVIEKIFSPSLRGLLQFGLNVPYSTLKNYYTEQRTLPRELFFEMCELAKIDPQTVAYKEIGESWGKSKGGKISKRKKGVQ